MHWPQGQKVKVKFTGLSSVLDAAVQLSRVSAMRWEHDLTPRNSSFWCRRCMSVAGAAYRWHSTTPTPTCTPTSSQGSSRECRRVGQLAIGITSGNRACPTCRRGSSRGCPCPCRCRRRGIPAYGVCMSIRLLTFFLSSSVAVCCCVFGALACWSKWSRDTRWHDSRWM